MTHFDDVYKQLNIQTKRIAIQYQVDALIAQNAKKCKRALSFAPACRSSHLGPAVR